ncbi:SMC-Scp complex subunit ScpB [Thermodesulfatator atlanticus]|uniref:SMC-Scp complex subunit ScpB n=1 Tax=Thermodesulfatator atlanticus TaxID=501497 RepID=UPI0003B4F0B5|nr:SMC-Scp complex subunit ScpB [Thermodesulfatator atlanticus]
MDAKELEKALEAVLFAAGRVVTLKELRKIFPEKSSQELKEALISLKELYKDRGITLNEVAGGYRFETRPDFAPYLRRLIFGSPPKLSRAALETLAIVAYKQPITKAEVEAIRGVDSSGALRNLLEKDLIKICGRKDVPGRPILYGTTPKFMEIFGLKDLAELPKLEELEKMLADGEH